jgi:hypothetical protein
MRILAAMVICSVALFFAVGPVGAADLTQPKATVNNIRQADPPKASNTQKPSPVGQPVSDYKPKGPSVHPKAPPPPPPAATKTK